MKARCIDEACTANASGTISVGSPAKGSAAGASARKLRLGGVKKKLGKGKTVALRLKISPKARKAARRALKKKRGVTARIKVTISDSAGNRRSLNRVVKLKLR